MQRCQVLNAIDLTHKVYLFDGFLKDQRFQLDFINEYSIMNLAVEKKLEYVMQCRGILFGIDHVALEMRSYQMDFRYYLVKHRSVRDLNKILIGVA